MQSVGFLSTRSLLSAFCQDIRWLDVVNSHASMRLGMASILIRLVYRPLVARSFVRSSFTTSFTHHHLPKSSSPSATQVLSLHRIGIGSRSAPNFDQQSYIMSQVPFPLSQITCPSPELSFDRSSMGLRHTLFAPRTRAFDGASELDSLCRRAPLMKDRNGYELRYVGGDTGRKDERSRALCCLPKPTLLDHSPLISPLRHGPRYPSERVPRRFGVCYVTGEDVW